MDHVFRWIERPDHLALTSTITLTELLVQPYRDGDEDLVDQFFGLLTTYPNLEWIPPDLAIADTAASLRARYRLRTPDALQAATAVRCRASGFITNDAAFERVEALETLLLDSAL